MQLRATSGRSVTSIWTRTRAKSRRFTATAVRANRQRWPCSPEFIRPPKERPLWTATTSAPAYAVIIMIHPLELSVLNVGLNVELKWIWRSSRQFGSVPPRRCPLRLVDCIGAPPLLLQTQRSFQLIHKSPVKRVNSDDLMGAVSSWW